MPDDRPTEPASTRTGAGHVPLRTLTAPGFLATGSHPALGPGDPVGRYELGPELGRGGMGIVYKATDADLDREVAVKVLRPDLPDAAGAAERFRFEARVTGRLDHFGVAPSHALGALPDGRPYLAMKLIRGHTLVELLKQRPDPAHDLPRFLQIFEHICQTVAFAHDKGIIHRDLKPANVMVGAFGEVRVMDWGLAKILGGPAVPNPIVEEMTTCPTFDPTQSCQTRAGTVMGTPAYMPAEQACGEIDKLGPPTDVFALGVILCEILTGTRVYGNRPGEQVLALAAMGDTTTGRNALARCAADPELVQIAVRCLAVNPAERPADAHVLADLMTTYSTGVEARLRKAEADRAAAEIKAQERRKRRKIQFALFCTAALIVIGLTVAVFDVRFRDAKTRATIAAELKTADDLRKQRRYGEAINVLDRADDLLSEGLADDLKPVVERVQADVGFAQQLDEIRMSKSIWLPDQKRFNTAAAPPAYRAAFAAHGLDMATADLDVLGNEIARSAVREEIVDALDDWSVDEPDPALNRRLLSVAKRVDPNPWRDRLRDPAVRDNPAELERLARDADPTIRATSRVIVLGELMQRHGLDPSRVMLQALNMNPTDFYLPFALGQWYVTRDPAQAVDHYRSARALRPDHAVVLANLGVVLAASGDPDGAEVVFKEAAARDPKAFGHLLKPESRKPIGP